LSISLIAVSIKDFTENFGFCQVVRGYPNPQAKFLACDKDRFCTLFATPNGYKMRAGSIYAATHFILQ